MARVREACRCCREPSEYVGCYISRTVSPSGRSMPGLADEAIFMWCCRIFPHRASIVAKRELQWVPLLGQYLTASGAVFVDRSNNTNAVKSLAAVGQTMKTRGTSLWMFPEGTRSLSPENTLLPFKRGAFHLAVQAGVPIVPVVCENYSWLYGPGKLESGNLKLRGESWSKAKCE